MALRDALYAVFIDQCEGERRRPTEAWRTFASGSAGSSRRALLPGAQAVVFTLLGCSILGGCGAATPKIVEPQAYEGALADLDNIMARMQQGDTLTTNPTAGSEARPAVTIPDAQIRFCIRRAVGDLDRANRNTAFDYAMLISAGLTGGVAAGMLSVSAVMDEGGGAKKDVGQAGVALTAATAGILALRTSLQLYETAKEQRVAAANNMAAAVSLIEKYAIADDPKDVTDDGFSVCRDGEVKIAGTYPGSSANAALEKAIQDAKKQKSDAAAESREKQAKSEEAAKNEKQTAEEVKSKKAALADEKKREDDPKFTALKENAPEKTAHKQRLDRLEKEVADAERREGVARAELQAAERGAQESNRQEKAAAYNEKKAAFLAASARLRRMLFFGTKVDVEASRTAFVLALQDMLRARQDIAVEDAKSTLARAEADLAVARETSRAAQQAAQTAKAEAEKADASKKDALTQQQKRAEKAAEDAAERERKAQKAVDDAQKALDVASSGALTVPGEAQVPPKP